MLPVWLDFIIIVAESLLCAHPTRQGITFRAGGKVEHLISINLAHSFRFVDGISRALLSARVEVQPLFDLT